MRERAQFKPEWNIDSEGWECHHRPGYFGRRRDEKIAALNKEHGEGNWQLAWVFKTKGMRDLFYSFPQACWLFYEESYFRHFKDKTEDILFLEQFGECYDNALTNVESGLDYTRQESFSTHIQDIAVRNMLARMGRGFKGPKDKLLEIRSRGEGLKFSPGVVPFYDPSLIEQPSLAPKWAERGSVEDFWQSNKWVIVRKDQR